MRLQFKCEEIVDNDGSKTAHLTPQADGNRWNAAVYGEGELQDNGSELIVGPMIGNHAEQFAVGAQYFVDISPAN